MGIFWDHEDYNQIVLARAGLETVFLSRQDVYDLMDFLELDQVWAVRNDEGWIDELAISHELAVDIATEKLTTGLVYTADDEPLQVHRSLPVFKAATAREKALAKLTPEDRQVLGLDT